MTAVRRILSIDGGGIMGVFPAAFLATVEESTGKSIAEHFDLVVGTSTGGIIALGLGLGIPARKVLAFYEEMGPDIFSGNKLSKWFRHLVSSKYDQKELEKSLKHTFGDRIFGESKTRLVIPSLKENGEVYLYKTAHHVDYHFDHKDPVVDIALATSAAPSYFPVHHSNKGLAMVDGGMWANNPTIVGVIEANTKLGWEANSLRVLSLGCTTAPVDLGIARRLPVGLAFWAKKSVDLFMAGQSSFSDGASKLIVGQHNFLRVSPLFPKERFKLDGVQDIKTLKAWGTDEARKTHLKLSQMFLESPVEPYKPFYGVNSK